MKITLRKAAALQSSINDFIKEIPLPSVTVISESQVAQDVIASAREKLMENFAKYNAMLVALYEIRESIGVANSTGGITSLLTKSALIDKRIALLEGFKNVAPADDIGVLTAKLKRLQHSNTESSLYARDSISSGILTDEQISEFRTEVLKLRKEKQAINDKILEANVKTEIDLSDSTVLLLAKEMLI